MLHHLQQVLINMKECKVEIIPNIVAGEIPYQQYTNQEKTLIGVPVIESSALASSLGSENQEQSLFSPNDPGSTIETSIYDLNGEYVNTIYDLKDYTNREHPTQRYILNYISTLLGNDNIPSEIDGCSAPTPFLTLEAMALLFQKLGSGQKEELNRVYDAMTEHPILVGGSNNFDTHFIKTMNSTGLTKVGGEAIRGIIIKTKDKGCVGLAIKVLDGSSRALPIATIKLLEHLKLLNKDQIKKLSESKNDEIKNHNGDKVGRIEAHLEF